MQTAHAGTPPSPSGPPSRLRKWGIRLLLAGGLVAVFLWALFTWAFYNPFRSPVGSLDGLVPASAGWVLRGDAAKVAAAPFFRRFVLDRSEKDQLLADWRLSDLVDRMETSERDLNTQLPSFLSGVTVMGDLFGGGTVAFGVTDVEDVRLSRFAVATRLSPRARMVVAGLKHEFVRRRIEASTGAKLTRYPLLLEVDTSALVEDPTLAAPAYLALVRDVLVFGNDRDLVMDAAALGESGGPGALRDRLDARDAFAATADAPVAGFLDVARLARDLEEAGHPTPADLLQSSRGLAGVVGLLLDPADLSTVSLGISFPGETGMDFHLAAVRGDGRPGPLAEALENGTDRPAADALAEAGALAPAGSAALVARLELSAGTVLRLLYGRAPADVRGAMEEGFRRGDTSLDLVARDADDLFQPGVSVVMERLPECDDIGLDSFGANEQGEFILPLPGVLLALRQRPGVETGAGERFLRRARQWIDFRVFEELDGLGHGMTGFRAEPKFLTGDLALVKPAVAFDGDLVLIASNEGTLRRALEARAGGRASFTDLPSFKDGSAGPESGQVTAFVEGGAWIDMLRDGRREAAIERVAHNWEAERKRVYIDTYTDLASRQASVAQSDINVLVDEEMARRVRHQKEVEFPDAVRAYVRELEGLRPLRSLVLGLARDPAGLQLRGALRVRAEGE